MLTAWPAFTRTKSWRLVRCDKPTGKMAAMKFLYPELGDIDATTPKPDRLRRLAEIMTQRQNGRLPRTIVNRLWAVHGTRAGRAAG